MPLRRYAVRRRNENRQRAVSLISTIPAFRAAWAPPLSARSVLPDSLAVRPDISSAVSAVTVTFTAFTVIPSWLISMLLPPTFSVIFCPASVVLLPAEMVTDWFPTLTVSASFPWDTVAERLPWDTVCVSFPWDTVTTRLPSSTVVVVSFLILAVWLFSTTSLWSFCAWKKTSSSPFLSSNRNSLNPPPLSEELDLKVERVLFAGRA